MFATTDDTSTTASPLSTPSLKSSKYASFMSSSCLQRRALDAVVEFVAAKGPALIPLADRIGRQLRVGGERRRAVLLGPALRSVAEAESRAVVPPAACIVGCAVEDFVADVRVLEADADELHEVLRCEPDRQPATVGGRIADIADANAGDAQPVLVRIERSDRLAERLAGAVAGIRAHRGVHANAALARIEADGMVRRREHDALDAVPARSLEQIVATDDVRLENGVPWPFDREAAEMHDAVDAGDGPLDACHVGEIGRHEAFVRCEVGGPCNVAQPDVGIDTFEQMAQPRADAARRASDQNRLHAALVCECGPEL